MKLVRLSRSDKKAVDRGWPAKTLLLEDAHSWVGGGENIGIQCGEVSEHFCAVDLDVAEARALAPYFLLDTLKQKKGEEDPSHWTYISEGAGYKRIAGIDDPEIIALKASNDGKGHYIVVGPSEHPTKGAYKWEGGFDFSKITRISSEDLEARVGRLGAATLIAQNMPQSGKHFYAQHLIGYLLKNGEQTDDVLDILRPAWGICNALSVEADRDLETLVENTAEKLQNNENVSGGGKLGEMVTNLPKRISQALGWSAADTSDGRTRFDLTDPGNADRLIAKHGKDIRFIWEWNSWIVWTGKRWEKKPGGDLMRMAVETAREIHAEAACEIDQDQQKRIYKHAMASQSESRLNSMISIARSYRGISPEDLDTDPMLFNVNNGTIDLRTGSLRPHNSEDLITKMAPVDFDPSARAPRFMRFLKQTLVEDELIAFMRRFLGYSLTGLTEERVLAVLYGVGKNGKSTLVELFQDLMGDYSSVAHPNTIMNTKHGDSNTQYQLAELVGTRFVSMSETKRGVELEEAVVKQITGNDTISARSPFGKPFAYRPQFKLWMSTNHKPEIPDGSEAIWDRMRLIPFNQRFDGKDADPKLPQALREELPGVLAWAVLGCVEWGQHGLGTSAAVERATSEYRAETDIIDRFFDDVCVFGPEHRVSLKGLFEAWESWCHENGEESGKQTGFTRVMKDRGKVKNFADSKSNGVRIWRGIGLAGSDPEGGGVVNEEGGGETLNRGLKPSTPPSSSRESDPEPPNSEKVTLSEKPLTYAESSSQEGGGENQQGHFSSNLSKGPKDTPHEGTLRKNDEKVTLLPQSDPDVLTTPSSWTFEGIEIDYMPEGE
jgi:putative DNA primase/helicase